MQDDKLAIPMVFLLSFVMHVWKYKSCINQRLYIDDGNIHRISFKLNNKQELLANHLTNEIFSR